jgi:hypothetical protein
MTFYEITDGDLSFSTGMSHHERSEWAIGTSGRERSQVQKGLE